jgi:hypothetical protein
MKPSMSRRSSRLASASLIARSGVATSNSSGWASISSTQLRFSKMSMK